MWWDMPVVSAGELKQEDCEFHANLGYKARSCLKKARRKKSDPLNVLK
jgi:hypothetical protein